MAGAGVIATTIKPRRVASASAERGPTLVQWALLTVLIGGFLASLTVYRAATLNAGHIVFLSVFAFSALWKLTAAAISRPPALPAPLQRAALPSYTIVVALYHEGSVVSELIEALRRLNYPAGRIQIIVALEDDDDETLSALAWLNLPYFVAVVVKHQDGPRTKPNALNAALARATGELLVVYDAEDRPHPDQLQEAAARFAVDPGLSYLQAPLRITNGDQSFLARQFAFEYAGQFEVVLPALARIGASFPLGGTSNHFRGIM